MQFEGKYSYFKDLAHRTNIAKSLSYHHQQLVCYQLSKSESLVKEMETAKGRSLKCVIMYYTFNMHTGNQCKVNELEYGDLFLEVCPLLNGSSDIHKYISEQ